MPRIPTSLLPNCQKFYLAPEKRQHKRIDEETGGEAAAVHRYVIGDVCQIQPDLLSSRRGMAVLAGGGGSGLERIPVLAFDPISDRENVRAYPGMARNSTMCDCKVYQPHQDFVSRCEPGLMVGPRAAVRDQMREGSQVSAFIAIRPIPPRSEVPCMMKSSLGFGADKLYKRRPTCRIGNEPPAWFALGAVLLLWSLSAEHER